MDSIVVYWEREGNSSKVKCYGGVIASILTTYK